MSKRVKPKAGQQYWIIDYYYTAEVRMLRWIGDRIDNLNYTCGNYFDTEAKAKAAARRVKKLLLSIPDSGEISTDLQDSQLPEWCKVGEWIYYPEDTGDFVYLKVSDIDEGFVSAKEQEDYSAWLISYKLICKSARQAHLRPYNAKEMKALMGKVIEHSGDCMLVTAYSQERNFIIADSVSQTPKDLLDGGYAIDGKPCGVLEHLDDNGVWIQ